MREFLLLGILMVLLQHSVAPPVSKTHEVEELSEKELVFEYERYLKEVVEALESDPTFRQTLEKADEADIRSGKIAHDLQYVSHHIRTKLDEIKRTELQRLKDLRMKMSELDEESRRKKLNHLDTHNEHTFEIEDLKKLIAKTTEELAEADKKRHEEFKEYEMQKKFEEKQKLDGNPELSEEEKKKYEAELEEMKKKHKDHAPLHHPGSQDQLEEVWEKQDHMEDQKFNPKTFFFMHDVDGNGLWDQDEVKALFVKELDKMYSNHSPEDDPRERIEEMERMREHVFLEADRNRDGFIDLEEFIAQTKRDEFKKDEGWKPLDEQEIYSQQEYEAFERQREEEIQRLIAQGLIPAHPDAGHHGQFPQHPDPSQMHQQGQVPNQQQQYQGHVPVPEQPHLQGQVNHQQQQYQGQVPVQQQYQGQVPVGQHPGQVPVQQHPGQVPVQQHPGQVPVQQHPGQVPVQQHPGQVPVGQHPGQVPVQQQQYQGQIPVQQQQHQLPQQVPRDQVPPNGQFQPVLHQQQMNQQIASQLPEQNEVNHQPQANGQAQPAPNIVHV